MMFVLFILILEYFDTIPYIGLRKKKLARFHAKNRVPPKPTNHSRRRYDGIQREVRTLRVRKVVAMCTFVPWFGFSYITKSIREEKPTPFIGDKGETQKESVVVMVWNNADLASAMTCYVGRKPRNTTRLSLSTSVEAIN